MEYFYLAGPTTAWDRYLEIENQVRAKVGMAPTCLTCKVPAVKFISTPAQIYDIPPEDFPAFPGAIIPYWDGEWYCPKCHHFVAATDIRKLRQGKNE